MILSDRHRFVFIHVPKCAGTSVRASVLPYHDADERFLKTVERHPELGEIDFRHLPLHLLRDLDPDAFEKLKLYDSYALLRDPFQRFRSSLAQRAKMYLGKEFAQLEPKEIREEIDKVISYLNSAPEVIASNFIHFARQSDFVQMDGVRLVRNLYPVERLDLFGMELGQHLGVERLEFGHANRTMTFRYPQMKHIMRQGSALVRRVLPQPAHEMLRGTARRLLMEPDDPETLPEFDDGHVRDFVTSYYADDIAMHREVLADTATQSRHSVAAKTPTKSASGT
ncbi:sulfotransferase family 2 domain-containing protein [Ruegeria sp. HKCCA5763]|uniref:sulfotransferase family 2 domain-containing protein n=1 Tax=Ruegeria sp. HKCCA5763 TaxID=2682987 RepID=UPI0014883A34|nr:sulfotransferase family 2 domain-containing protein [Ruegeria sp. HKCCA5763]